LNYSNLCGKCKSPRECHPNNSYYQCDLPGDIVQDIIISSYDLRDIKKLVLEKAGLPSHRDLGLPKKYYLKQILMLLDQKLICEVVLRWYILRKEEIRSIPDYNSTNAVTPSTNAVTPSTNAVTPSTNAVIPSDNSELTCDMS
jgi:hypothetical protein